MKHCGNSNCIDPRFDRENFKIQRSLLILPTGIFLIIYYIVPGTVLSIYNTLILTKQTNFPGLVDLTFYHAEVYISIYEVKIYFSRSYFF